MSQEKTHSFETIVEQPGKEIEHGSPMDVLLKTVLSSYSPELQADLEAIRESEHKAASTDVSIIWDK